MKFKLVESVYLNEMAMERSDAIELCTSLGKRFVERFIKIVMSSSDDAIDHWVNREMQPWLNQVKDIVLKQSKRQISISQLIDWFFTAGSSVDIIIKDPNIQDLYNKFLSKIVSSMDVEKALSDMGYIYRVGNILHKNTYD